jgi:hypothetical protein
MDAMTTTTAPATTQQQISPMFFRFAFATLLVGTLLSLGAFATVAYSGSIAQTGTTTVATTP